MFDDLILAIGTARFDKLLFETMRSELAARQVVVHRYVSGADIRPIAVEEHEGYSQVRGLVDSYVRTLNARDPFRPLLIPSPCRETQIVHISADEIDDLDYRRRLFIFPGIVGKLSIIVRTPNQAISISAYRGCQGGCFSGRDQERLQPHVSTLAAIVERHCSMLVDRIERPNVGEITEAFLSLNGRKRLSVREAAVCARIVIGHTNESISLDLGISFHSVTTYRRRAYEKLGITSQNQLFQALLRAPSGISAPQLAH